MIASRMDVVPSPGMFGMNTDSVTPTPVPISSAEDMFQMSSASASMHNSLKQGGRERRLSESGRALVNTLGGGIPPIGKISSLLINAMHGSNGTDTLGLNGRNNHNTNHQHSISSFLTAMGQTNGGMGMMDSSSSMSQLAGPDLGDPMTSAPTAKPKRTKPKIRWSSKEHRATMQQAVEAVLVNGNTTKVAEQFGIPARTLRRYVAKEKQRRDANATLVPNDVQSKMTAGMPVRSVSKPIPVSRKGIRKPEDRTRTDSIDFVMNHIGNKQSGQASLSECFGKEMIMSFGAAASSGRLRTMSTEDAKRGRARTRSVDRILFEQLKSITPTQMGSREGRGDTMDMDMDGFEIPILCDDVSEVNAVEQSSKMVPMQQYGHGRSRAMALKIDSKKRDRNASLDILSLKFEPAAQRSLLSKSPGIDSSLLLGKSPGVGSLLSKSLTEWMASGLGTEGRHRTSTVDSSMFAADLDADTVTAANLPDFGFSFEK